MPAILFLALLPSLMCDHRVLLPISVVSSIALITLIAYRIAHNFTLAIYLIGAFFAHPQHFPHLQYLHLDEITPVVVTSTHARRTAVPSLQTLVVFSELDDQLREIDFSGLATLTVVGAEDAGMFLAHG